MYWNPVNAPWTASTEILHIILWLTQKKCTHNPQPTIISTNIALQLQTTFFYIFTL